MKIIEKKIVGKYGDMSKCEDMIVVTSQYLAVMDGATAKSDNKFNNVSPGKAIVASLSDFFDTSVSGIYGQELVSYMSDYVKEKLLCPNGYCYPSIDSPSASIAVYSIKDRVITVVGDISIMIDGELNRHYTKFDKCMSEVRSIVNWLMMEKGDDIIGDSGVDAGREYIKQILGLQYLFRNKDSNNPWSYGNIDGFAVPSRFIKEYHVQENQEIVICTDGYPIVENNLRKSEAALQRSLKDDPLQTFVNMDTKGKFPGQLSYDDRAYVRFVS